jgi:hypothetical protein
MIRFVLYLFIRFTSAIARKHQQASTNGQYCSIDSNTTQTDATRCCLSAILMEWRAVEMSSRMLWRKTSLILSHTPSYNKQLNPNSTRKHFHPACSALLKHLECLYINKPLWFDKNVPAVKIQPKFPHESLFDWTRWWKEESEKFKKSFLVIGQKIN